MSMLRRIGIIGDVHAEDEFLAIALDRVAHERVDRILCVGDIVDGRGDVDRCIELLGRNDVATVRGNHDRWMLRDEMRDLASATMRADITSETRAYIHGLPATLRFETVAGPMLLCHGFGDDDMVFVDQVLAMEDPTWRRKERGRLLRLIPKDVKIVVAGHTHRRMVRRLGRLIAVDAGTLRSGDNPCFAVADFGAKTVQFYDLDEDARVMESEQVVL